MTNFKNIIPFTFVCCQHKIKNNCTIADFEIPKKYGLRQTIADTLGIGGIMRGRCVNQIDAWKKEYAELCESGVKEHERSIEYGFRIMQSIIENKPY